jgi:hypothetical protein
MSIFSKTDRNSVYEIPVIEGYSWEAHGALNIELETLNYQENIIESIATLDKIESSAIRDVNKLEEQAVSESTIENLKEKYEVAYENWLDTVKDTIVKGFKKLSAMVMSFIDSVVMFFDKLVKSNQDFMKKYEAKYDKLELSGHKVKSYNYANLDAVGKEAETIFDNVKVVADKVIDLRKLSAMSADELKALATSYTEKKEATSEALRANFLSEKTKDAEEFKNKLFLHFRGLTEKKDKEDMELSKTEVKTFMLADNAVKHIKNVQSDAKKMFGETIKELESLASAMKKGAEGTGKYASGYRKEEGKEREKMTDEIQHKGQDQAQMTDCVRKHIQIVTEGKGYALAFISAWRSAAESKNTDYRKYVTSAFSYKKS